MTVVLVANTGGHLAQAYRLRQALAGSASRSFVTFDNHQSRSLLREEVVSYVPAIGSRDWRGTLRCAARARAHLQALGATSVYSTGAAIALAYLPAARSLGLPACYIESAARTEGPSVTGRLLQLDPGIELRTQWPAWASRRWRPGPTVFDSFTFVAASRPTPQVQRVVVTTGTMPFGFRALLEAVIQILPDRAEVTWQTGTTDLSGLDIEGFAFLPHEDLISAMRAADVVVSHAGVGSALAAFDAGKKPILVPRRAARGEHIDDHQEQIARALSERGLVFGCELEALSLGVLEDASLGTVLDSTTL